MLGILFINWWDKGISWVKWGVRQAFHDLCLQQTSEIPCHICQISFVEKFKKFGRKSLRFLAVKVLYVTTYET